MTPDEQRRDEQLNAIGRQLDDMYFSGRLDFDGFKSLVTRAIAVAGSDTSDLEMFCHYCRGEGWLTWMMQEIQKSPSRRVA